MPKVLNLDEIKSQINIPQLIQAIEDGFVLYSEDKVVVPPVGFLNFKQPPGDVHIKYGFIEGDDQYVIKIAAGFYDNPRIGLSSSQGLMLVFSRHTGVLEAVLHHGFARPVQGGV